MAGDTYSETGGPARLPAQVEILYGEEKTFSDQSSQGRIKVSCTGMTSPTIQTRKDPFQLYSLSPNHLGFNSQQGPPLSGLFGSNSIAAQNSPYLRTSLRVSAFII